MSSRSVRLRAAALAAVLALGLAGCTGGGSKDFDSGLQIGEGGITTWEPGTGPKLPALSGTTIEGTPLDLAAWKGSVIVLNQWGSWCGPCRDEAPLMAEVERTLAPQGVRFVGIDVREGGDVVAAKKFQTDFGIGYPSLDDKDGKHSLALRQLIVGNQSPPQTVVIGRDGRAVGRISQGAEKSVLLGMVEDALGAGGSTGATSPAPSPSS